MPQLRSREHRRKKVHIISIRVWGKKTKKQKHPADLTCFNRPFYPPTSSTILQSPYIVYNHASKWLGHVNRWIWGLFNSNVNLRIDVEHHQGLPTVHPTHPLNLWRPHALAGYSDSPHSLKSLHLLGSYLQGQIDGTVPLRGQILSLCFWLTLFRSNESPSFQRLNGVMNKVFDFPPRPGAESWLSS